MPNAELWLKAERSPSKTRTLALSNSDIERRLRTVTSRAALAGKSLSDYLLGEIREVAERPTIEDLRARLAQRVPVAPSFDPALAVRAERERS